MSEIWVKMDTDEWNAIRYCAQNCPPGEPTWEMTIAANNTLMQYGMLVDGDPDREVGDNYKPLLLPSTKH